MQFRTGAKRTKTARTDCEDERWSLEIENNSTSTPNSNLLTNWRWIHGTISQRVNFQKYCIANAKWMAFANWKVAIFYVVNGAALEQQFARKSYVSVLNCVAILSARKCWNFDRARVCSVHASIFTICVCFSNCCFGILMSRSFSFNQSIWQVNPGSLCQKIACLKRSVWYYVTASYPSQKWNHITTIPLHTCISFHLFLQLFVFKQIQIKLQIS